MGDGRSDQFLKRPAADVLPMAQFDVSFGLALTLKQPFGVREGSPMDEAKVKAVTVWGYDAHISADDAVRLIGFIVAQAVEGDGLAQLRCYLEHELAQFEREIADFVGPVSQQVCDFPTLQAPDLA